LIVLSNPRKAEEFSRKINELLDGKTADNFTISIEETVNSFDEFDSIYIAHYFGKSPRILIN
jgi:hypothetical protein